MLIECTKIPFCYLSCDNQFKFPREQVGHAELEGSVGRWSSQRSKEGEAAELKPSAVFLGGESEVKAFFFLLARRSSKDNVNELTRVCVCVYCNKQENCALIIDSDSLQQ